jgi:hypothetical protein
MWPTWNTVFTWWRHVIWVVFVAVVVCMSACSGPGRSGSTPAALSPDAGQAVTVGSGDGGTAIETRVPSLRRQVLEVQAREQPLHALQQAGAHRALPVMKAARPAVQDCCP